MVRICQSSATAAVVSLTLFIELMLWLFFPDSSLLSTLSALDAENEFLVQEALERLMEGGSLSLSLPP